VNALQSNTGSPTLTSPWLQPLKVQSLRQTRRGSELQAILDQVNDRAVYLRLAETLSAFLAKLRGAAGALDIQERQRIVRLIVKEILIEDESIIVRHSIPVSQPPDDDPKSPPSRSGEPKEKSYLLRNYPGPLLK
jgi:site-specific DNA recombinase